MAIKVQGQTVVGDDRKGSFQVTNPGQFTTAQRDALTPVIGDMIFNIDEDNLEIWDGTDWKGAGGGDESKPPQITSVVLSEKTTGGDRFTSQDFTVGIALNEGIPVSQKGVKASVTAQFDRFPESSNVSNNDSTNDTTISPSMNYWPTKQDPGKSSETGWWGTYYDPTSKKDVFFCMVYDGNSKIYRYTVDYATWLQDSEITAVRPTNWSVACLRANAKICAPLNDPAGLWFATDTRDSGNGTFWVEFLNDNPNNMQGDVQDIKYHNGYYFVAYGDKIYVYDDATKIDGRVALAEWTITHSNGTLTCSKIAFSENQFLICANSQNYFARGAVFDLPSPIAQNASYTLNSSTSAEVYPDRYGRGFGYTSYNKGNWFTVIDSYLRRLERNSNNTNNTWLPCSPEANTLACESYFINEDDNLIACFNYSDPTFNTARVSTWFISYNGGTSWTPYLKHSSDGASASNWNTEYGNVSAPIVEKNGFQMFSARRNVTSGSADFSNRLWIYQRTTQSLTFSSPLIPEFIDGDGISVEGQDDSLGTIGNISADRLSASIYMDYIVQNGDKIIGLDSIGSAIAEKFLVIDSSVNVTSMQTADPGFVEVGPGSSFDLKFPATFPSGKTPDEELPAGTSIKAFAEATNASASSTFGPSNTITPA